MNFDRDYTNFLHHITDVDKNGTAGPIKFSYKEDAFARLFVAYLNYRYKNRYWTGHRDLEKTA